MSFTPVIRITWQKYLFKNSIFLISFMLVLFSKQTFAQYSNDFEESVGSEWSTNATAKTPSGERQFIGQFGNETVSLNLIKKKAGLVTISFDLFVINSWDGNNTEYGPDGWYLNVTGGDILMHTTFSNLDENDWKQSYPSSYLKGEHPPASGAKENNSLGYDYYGDSVYHFNFTFQHNFGPIEINFTAKGLQELGDESWGLDNVIVKGAEKAVWQSVICEEDFGMEAWSQQKEKVQKLQVTSQNAIQQSPDLPTKVMFRSSTPVVTRFDDRWDIIAEIIKNRGSDNYLTSDFRNAGHAYEFLELAKRNLKFPRKGFSFGKDDFRQHHLLFKERLELIKHHRDMAQSEFKSYEAEFNLLMGEVQPTHPIAAGAMKGVIFSLNKALEPPAAIARGIGVLSLVASSYQILVSLNDLDTLNDARLKKNLFLQSLEDFAYLNGLYSKYLAIYKSQEQILKCD
jgi:hypothetical protein